MTLAELKSIVYRDAPGLVDFLDESALTQFFNECQRQLSFFSQRIEVKEIDIVDGVFSLPSDCLVFKSVSYDGKRLLPWPGDSLPKIVTGYPAYYFQAGNNFYIIPIPKDNLPLKVSIFYISRPQDMQLDNDTPALADCDEVLTAYALWNVLKAMGEDDSAWERIYNERLQMWILLNRSANYRRERIRMEVF